jgi:hypothetical protein
MAIEPTNTHHTDTEEDCLEAAYRSGGEIALYHMARAWLDRWQACGGDFGWSWNADGSCRGMVRGMPEADYWTPTDEGNDKLPPHTWLVEERHQSGAVKVLEGLMVLVPGLRETVHDIVGSKLLANDNWQRVKV